MGSIQPIGIHYLTRCLMSKLIEKINNANERCTWKVRAMSMDQKMVHRSGLIASSENMQ